MLLSAQPKRLLIWEHWAGTYNLNLYNGAVQRTGKLIVSSDSYTIDWTEDSIFGFTNTLLNRIPEHTIWGYVGYHEQKTLPLVESFFDALMDLGATKKTYASGYYDAFEIDGNGDITLSRNLGYWFEQIFIFHYPGDLAKVEQLLEQYNHDYGEYLNIEIDTDKGERFLSWRYK